MFVIKTPNPNYDGVTCGVKFQNGTAVVEDENLRRVLVNDYGYLSEAKPEEKPPQEEDAPKAPKPRKAAAKPSAK
ncbi:hypothetical protein [Paenibacillus sp. ACRRY]|uniref:hypothetical protein n=1 Tax=Paenibacillus sp. ACRRY TaxID=2918208 RepID=UPI001EF4DF5F|nr:hypothetical protein [Paenibacillus sp. ACRRY]MCG7386881.1 hypothetical protein [Paenibacillus sp. ACRRY]